MGRRQTDPPRRGRRRIIAGAVASILAHLLIAILLLTAEPPADLSSRKESVRLRILDSAARAAQTAARPRETLDGQVIDVPKPAREEVPENARFLSRWNTKVEKEMKARRTATGKGGLRGSPEGAREPAAQPEAGEAEARASLPAPAPSGGPPSGTSTPDRPGRGRRGIAGLEKLLAPALGGARGAARSAGALSAGDPSGGMVSSDAILGVPEEGDANLVNTRSFKYWDFFQRVKERVRDEWNPGASYQARDPYGKVYGSKDRLTVLAVTLDMKGAVQRLQVVRESGLPFLDEEAMRAFRQAGPFPNPPAGLGDDSGRIAFSFGFLLEVGASQGRFFWQRQD